MNQHLRFATASPRPRRGSVVALAACALALPFTTSCQTADDRLLSVSESVPPRLAKNKSFLHVQCHFIIAPDDFQLLESTQGAHVAGFYSPQDGEKLLQSMKRRKGFDLLSSPSMTLRQGNSGTIEVVHEFIYPTEYKPPQTALKKPGDFGPATGSASFPITPATPSAFETTNLGITAKFKGSRSKSGDVQFTTTIERRILEGFINYGTPVTTPARDALGRKVQVNLTDNNILMPVIHTKRMNTSVSIADGHYLAIGGLQHLPTPALRDQLTWHKTKEPQKDGNLLILVRVKAVDSKGE